MTSSEFTQGDDFVAARLSIDVPTEGISTLRELTQEVERYRVGAEAAGRAQDDFIAMLRQTADVAERTNTVLERTLEIQERLSSMGAGPGGSGVPPGYQQPFGEDAGTGRGRTPGSPGEAQQQLDDLRQRDPRAYVNMQAQRGNTQPGDIPGGSDQSIREAASRINDREKVNYSRNGGTNPLDEFIGGLKDGMTQGMPRGLGDQVFNENGGGLGALMSRMSAKAAGGLEGGALGGLGGLGGLGMLLKGGGIAGLAMAGFGASQELGEMYQGYKNAGMVRGGGAAEGFSNEMSARVMAMNPFLTTEQSRQIIQGALTDGYTGKTFDTVTQFMTHNLTEMNMSVAQSAELLRKNVNEGGQSIAGLAANLGILKEMSKDGNKSLPQLQAEFSSTSANLMNFGMSGPESERAAMLSSKMFNTEGDQGVKDIGTQLTNALATPRGAAFMTTMGGMQLRPGVMPSAAAYGMTGDQMAQSSQSVAINFAKQIHNNSGSPPQGSPQWQNNVMIFHSFLQRLGVNVPGAEVAQYYDKIVYEGRDPYSESKKSNDQAAQADVSVQERGLIDRVGNQAGSAAGAIGNNLADVGKTLWSSAADLFSGNASRIPGRMSEAEDRILGRGRTALDQGGKYHIAAMDRIIEQLGGVNQMEILDKNRKPVEYDPDDKAQMDALSRGDYTWRQKGSQGPGITLSQTPGGGDNFKDRVAQVQGSLVVELGPNAQKAGFTAPTSVPLTPHEQQANMGYGGATPNNAPPGEGTLTRGAR